MFASLLALSLAYAPGLGVTHGRTLGPSCRRSAVVTMGPPIEMLPKPTDDEIAKIKSSWGTWGCEAMPLSHALFFEHARLPPNSHERDACRLCVPGDVSEFPWTYSDDEAALILEGEVTVVPDDGNPAVTIKAGDYVKFPKGMSCTWKVTKAINKHYKFG